MSRIQTINMKNFKAISEKEIDFKGCTAIITGKNDSGKTSLLRGMIERIRFIRPDVMVKSGEDSGSGELTLDTGEKFNWEFDVNGKDKIFYTSEKGIRQALTKEIGKQFFPPTFDIDKFLQSSPKDQSLQLQKIVGVDFTDIDTRYKQAYDKRTEDNREAEKFHVKLSNMLKVPKVDAVDLTELQNKKEAERNRLNSLYLKNKESNDKLREDWNTVKEKINDEVSTFNHNQSLKRQEIEKYLDFHIEINNVLLKENKLFSLVSLDKLKEFVDSLPKPEADKKASDLYPKEPEYVTEMPEDTELQKIDAEILTASQTNTEAQKYLDYIIYKAETEAAKVIAEDSDKLVKSIEAERQKMIEGANFPTGVSLSSEGVMINGLPLDKNQISTSKVYTTALRIASMSLGEVRTLYFDASYLDKFTLAEIEKWAEENDLQLLIERPDFEGKEITYELIEHK